MAEKNPNSEVPTTEIHEKEPGEPSEGKMRAELKKRGYDFVLQKPGEEVVKIDGDEVAVPFTNSHCEVIVRKGENGKWQYVSRGFLGEQFHRELRILYEVEVLGLGE